MWIIDRFEENNAVLENATTQEIIRLENFPKNAKVGDVLLQHDNAWVIDKNETANRRERIFAQFERLKKRNV